MPRLSHEALHRALFGRTVPPEPALRAICFAQLTVALVLAAVAAASHRWGPANGAPVLPLQTMLGVCVASAASAMSAWRGVGIYLPSSALFALAGAILAAAHARLLSAPEARERHGAFGLAATSTLLGVAAALAARGCALLLRRGRAPRGKVRGRMA